MLSTNNASSSAGRGGDGAFNPAAIQHSTNAQIVQSELYNRHADLIEAFGYPMRMLDRDEVKMSFDGFFTKGPNWKEGMPWGARQVSMASPYGVYSELYQAKSIEAAWSGGMAIDHASREAELTNHVADLKTTNQRLVDQCNALLSTVSGLPVGAQSVEPSLGHVKASYIQLQEKYDALMSKHQKVLAEGLSTDGSSQVKAGSKKTALPQVLSPGTAFWTAASHSGTSSHEALGVELSGAINQAAPASRDYHAIDTQARESAGLSIKATDPVDANNIQPRNILLNKGSLHAGAQGSELHSEGGDISPVSDTCTDDGSGDVASGDVAFDFNNPQFQSESGDMDSSDVDAETELARRAAIRAGKQAVTVNEPRSLFPNAHAVDEGDDIDQLELAIGSKPEADAQDDDSVDLAELLARYKDLPGTRLQRLWNEALKAEYKHPQKTNATKEPIKLAKLRIPLALMMIRKGGNYEKRAISAFKEWQAVGGGSGNQAGKDVMDQFIGWARTVYENDLAGIVNVEPSAPEDDNEKMSGVDHVVSAGEDHAEPLGKGASPTQLREYWADIKKHYASNAKFLRFAWNDVVTKSGVDMKQYKTSDLQEKANAVKRRVPLALLMMKKGGKYADEAKQVFRDWHSHPKIVGIEAVDRYEQVLMSWLAKAQKEVDEVLAPESAAGREGKEGGVGSSGDHVNHQISRAAASRKDKDQAAKSKASRRTADSIQPSHQRNPSPTPGPTKVKSKASRPTADTIQPSRQRNPTPTPGPTKVSAKPAPRLIKRPAVEEPGEDKKQDVPAAKGKKVTRKSSSKAKMPSAVPEVPVVPEAEGSRRASKRVKVAKGT